MSAADEKHTHIQRVIDGLDEIDGLPFGKVEAALSAIYSHAQRAQAENERLRAALKGTTGELENLFAMCGGEVPSLLEDHHSFPTIVAAIEAGNAALSESRS